MHCEYTTTIAEYDTMLAGASLLNAEDSVRWSGSCLFLDFTPAYLLYNHC